MPHSLGFGIDAAVVTKVKSTTVALPTRSVTCSSLHDSMLERASSSCSEIGDFRTMMHDFVWQFLLTSNAVCNSLGFLL
jgi:hypothetical protein